jgi:DNA-binding CsgD family transcriptional regulator
MRARSPRHRCPAVDPHPGVAESGGRHCRSPGALECSDWHPLLAWLPIENTLQEAIRTQGTSATAGSEKSSEIGSEMGAEKSSQRELEVLELLSAQPRLSARELGEWLGISQRAIEKHLAALQRQGRLRRQGSPPSGSWQVLPSGSGA